ncbi:Cystathionine gamma-synthase 1 chloroplastic [Bienertia sinuspersici]
MAVSSSCYARVFPSSFECRPEPEFSSHSKPKSEIPSSKTSFFPRNGVSSSLILRFPPNFVRQLSTKARRNCSNIGVAQVVAASWTHNNNSADSAASCGGVPAATAVDAPLSPPLIKSLIIMMMLLLMIVKLLMILLLTIF